MKKENKVWFIVNDDIGECVKNGQSILTFTSKKKAEAYLEKKRNQTIHFYCKGSK